MSTGFWLLVVLPVWNMRGEEVQLVLLVKPEGKKRPVGASSKENELEQHLFLYLLTFICHGVVYFSSTFWIFYRTEDIFFQCMFQHIIQS